MYAIEINQSFFVALVTAITGAISTTKMARTGFAAESQSSGGSGNK